MRHYGRFPTHNPYFINHQQENIADVADGELRVPPPVEEAMGGDDINPDVMNEEEFGDEEAMGGNDINPDVMNEEEFGDGEEGVYQDNADVLVGGHDLVVVGGVGDGISFFDGKIPDSLRFYELENTTANSAVTLAGVVNPLHRSAYYVVLQSQFLESSFGVSDLEILRDADLQLFQNASKQSNYYKKIQNKNVRTEKNLYSFLISNSICRKSQDALVNIVKIAVLDHGGDPSSLRLPRDSRTLRAHNQIHVRKVLPRNTTTLDVVPFNANWRVHTWAKPPPPVTNLEFDFIPAIVRHITDPRR
jgi:hypothetical protein